MSKRPGPPPIPPRPLVGTEPRKPGKAGGPPPPPAKGTKQAAKRPSRPPPPPPPRGEERRAHERYDLLAQVQLTRESEVHILSTSNISRGGFFICADPEERFELEVGAEVDVLLFSPDHAGPEIAARAKVMRLVEGKGGCGQGYGLRFESFRAGDVMRFDELLRLAKS